MPRPPAPPPRGILERAAVPDGEIAHQRTLPVPSLAPFIEHFWSVRWDLRAPFVAETLPHPSVHLVFEVSAGKRRAEITGVPTGRFTRTLRGAGAVFGIKFRPASFQPVLKGSMSTLTDRLLRLSRVFGGAARPFVASMLAALPTANEERLITTSEAFLEARRVAMPAEVARMRDLVERLATDRSITTVEAAAALAGLDVRTLQRRFGRYVGVSPKWVIQRYRLHEAAALLAEAEGPSLASIAASLGYFDQPHFVRDFKAVVGHPPGRYRDRRCPRPSRSN